MAVETINDYIDQLSKEVENDSVVYIFKTGYVWGMSRERILKTWGLFNAENATDYFNFFETLLKRKAGEISNVIYKNNNGTWIKLLALFNENHFSDPFTIANYPDMEERYKLSSSYIPEMDYVDKDGNMYRVLEKDNSKDYIRKQPIYINELDQDIVKLHQFSIDNPSYGFTLRHLMNDLRIQILDKSIDIDNILINLNGLFVEPIKLTNYPDSIFIKNARYSYKTILGKLKEDATPQSTKNDTEQKLGADVYYEDEDYNKNYSINVKLFQWKDVNISPWLPVLHINYQFLVIDYKNIRIPKSFVFERELPEERTLIICDGTILDPSEYTIDGKTVTLKYIVNDFNRLYYEFKTNNIKGALNQASFYVNNRYYYAIVFEDTDETRGNMVLRTSAPLEIGFLGYNTVLFDEVNTSDFLLVDGMYLPFNIKSNGLIEYPHFFNDNLYFEEDLFKFKDRKITKIELVNYGNTIIQK